MFFRKLNGLLRSGKINTKIFSYSTAKDMALKSLKYSLEESEKIIDIVNKSNMEELLNYRISKKRAMSLQSWKQKHGELKDLKDLLDIGGINLNVLKSFCNSMLEPLGTVTPLEGLERKVAAFSIPKMSRGHRQKIRSTVAIHIGVSSITWSRLELCNDTVIKNMPTVFTHWEHHDFKESKPHLSNLVERCIFYDHLIPIADCYILEDPKVAQSSSNPGNAEQQNISIQRAQMIAMISLVLEARHSLKSSDLQKLELEEKNQHEGNREEIETKLVSVVHEDDGDSNKISEGHDKQHLVEYDLTQGENEKKKLPQPNVFFLRRFLAARLFNRLVGNERVSTEQLVFDLMRLSCKDLHAGKPLLEKDNLRGCVEFPPEFGVLFSKSERFQREFLGQALLLNIAFQRLVLHQDAKSIRKVTKSTKAKRS